MPENEQDLQENTDFEDYDKNSNGFVPLAILTSIIFFILPSLLMFLFAGKNKLTSFEYKTVVALLNFEIYFVIISIALKCLFDFITFPIFGALVHGLLFPILFFINLVICIRALQAYNKGEAYIYPISSPKTK